jgi:hypothetical protein
MMRSCLPIVIALSLIASEVMAQSSNLSKLPEPTPSGKTLSKTSPIKTAPPRTLPMKGASSATPCAAYGPGFVKVEGTDTCMQIGGAVSIGVGGAIGRR